MWSVSTALSVRSPNVSPCKVGEIHHRMRQRNQSSSKRHFPHPDFHHSSFSPLPPNKSLLPVSPYSPCAVILLFCQLQPTRCCPLRFAAQLRRTSTPYLPSIEFA